MSDDNPHYERHLFGGDQSPLNDSDDMEPDMEPELEPLEEESGLDELG